MVGILNDETGHASKHGIFSWTMPSKVKNNIAITHGTIKPARVANIVSKGTKRLYMDIKQHNNYLVLTK